MVMTMAVVVVVVATAKTGAAWRRVYGVVG